MLSSGLLLGSLATANPAGAGTVTPTLTVTASPSTAVGYQIFANANVMGANNPSGTLTFRLFGPGDTECESPIFTSQVEVTGTSVNSSRYTTSEAGTYRWVARYSGDDAHSPAGPSACSEPSASVVVSRANTVLDIVRTPAAGRVVRGTAALSGGFHPKGSITFALSPPGDTFCSQRPVFSSTVPVSGNGTYTSEKFTVPGPGTYRWRATYSGDADNLGEGPTACLETDAAVTVKKGADGDYDGDAKADAAVYRPATGTWWVKNSSAPATARQWGMLGDVPVPGDYDGDGEADSAVYRPLTGTWWVTGSSGTASARPWGMVGDVPVPGDYDGDYITDLGVYRPTTGGWWVTGSSGNDTARTWGTVGDIPVPGDYDGDGKTDIAVYRPSTGAWWIVASSGRTIVAAWGTVGDIPVPGDYDGDGKSDLAIYRATTGTWWVDGSSGRDVVQSWGATDAVPVPGDYDGDGKTDMAVFNRSTGAWLIRGSTGATQSLAWGTAGDLALALPAAIATSFFAA